MSGTDGLRLALPGPGRRLGLSVCVGQHSPGRGPAHPQRHDTGVYCVRARWSSAQPPLTGRRVSSCNGRRPNKASARRTCGCRAYWRRRRPRHSDHEAPLAGPTGGSRQGTTDCPRRLVGAYRPTATADRSVHTTTSDSERASTHRQEVASHRPSHPDPNVWLDLHKGNLDPCSAWALSPDPVILVAAIVVSFACVIKVVIFRFSESYYFSRFDFDFRPPLVVSTIDCVALRIFRQALATPAAPLAPPYVGPSPSVPPVFLSRVGFVGLFDPVRVLDTLVRSPIGRLSIHRAAIRRGT